MSGLRDLRQEFFQGANWYETLGEPSDDQVSVWRLAKWEHEAWWIDLINVGVAFALQHGLGDSYRQRFAGISARHFGEDAARLEGRSVFHPIWAIANELIVGAYLQQVLGWTFLRSEPGGDGKCLGDLEFRTPSGKIVFVEVKTPTELRPTAQVFTRDDYSLKIREVIARAYRQLPADGRAVLVVIVGEWITEISHGILHTDVFAALFGHYILRFTVMVDNPEITYQGPSFHNMVVHGSKHRRIGAVAGMLVRGYISPGPVMYVIDNPYAHTPSRLSRTDLDDVRRYVVDANGTGTEEEGISLASAWTRMEQIGDCAPDQSELRS